MITKYFESGQFLDDLISEKGKEAVADPGGAPWAQAPPGPQI